MGRLKNNVNGIELEWNNHPSAAEYLVGLEDTIERLKGKSQSDNKAVCMNSSEFINEHQHNSLNQHESSTYIESKVTDAEWWTMVSKIITHL